MPTSSTRLQIVWRENRLECRSEQDLLQRPIDVGHDDDQACMQWGRRIELPENRWRCWSPARSPRLPLYSRHSSLPAGLADPGDVLRFVPGFAGDRDQIDTEALIDEEPHPASIAASFRRWRRWVRGQAKVAWGAPTRRIGGDVKWRQLHHFGGEARIGLMQLGRGRAICELCRDRMHRHPRAPKHRLTAEDAPGDLARGTSQQRLYALQCPVRRIGRTFASDRIKRQV
jgi:hypothetical protein